jgi:pimeloyl-ACP methyl ester carboxylesterase
MNLWYHQVMMTRRSLEYRSMEPAVRRYSRPLLLIHGAWHGAWCWHDAMQDFTRRGFCVHVVSLRGHGKSDRPSFYHLCRFDDYLRDIDTAIAHIEPTPIVIAHSMGGLLIQHYLQSRQLPGVILLCSMPHTGTGRFLQRWMIQHPLATLRTLFTFDSRHLIGTPPLAREAFFRSTISPTKLARYASLLDSEPLMVAVDSMFRTLQPKRCLTPMLVVAAEADAVFTQAEQRAMADAYGVQWMLIPGGAHDLMLDPAWPIVADAIEQFVANGLSS